MISRSVGNRDARVACGPVLLHVGRRHSRRWGLFTQEDTPGAAFPDSGPKAGGPNYLRRFVTEQVVTINTAAAGGNASLLTAEE